MSDLALAPNVIAPYQLSVLLKDFITEYFPKLSYCAVRFKGNNAYFLIHEKMTPAYEICLATRVVIAVAPGYEKHEERINRYFREMHWETIDSLFEQLKELRARFPDFKTVKGG